MSVELKSFAELVTFLNERGIPNGANLPEQVAELPIRMPPLEDLVHVRWEKHLPYIQVICVMVRDVPAARVHQVEIACSRANSTIPLPGFGFDYTRSSIYFRHTWIVRDGVRSSFLEQVVLAVATNAREFLIPFRRIVGEGLPGEKILDLAVEFVKSDVPPAPPAKA